MPCRHKHKQIRTCFRKSLFAWWERVDSPKGPRVKNSPPDCFCHLRTAHPVRISTFQPQNKRAPTLRWYSLVLVGAGGFEPPKSKTTDLQSAPFGHSGTLPYLIVSFNRAGAGGRTQPFFKSLPCLWHSHFALRG